METENKIIINWVIGTSIAILVIIVLSMAIAPRYKLYKQDLLGQANLRQQEWEKQIAIEEARALKESAVLKAEAEVARARGVAEANAIISDSLKGNDEYLRYLWIDQLSNGQAGQVIYIPTEAGLPILEANRF